MNLYSGLYKTPFISKELRYGPYKTSFTCFTTQHKNLLPLLLQLQGVTARQLVLIAPTHEGMAKDVVLTK